VQERAHELRMVTRVAAEGAPDRVEAERRAFAGFFDFISRHGNLYRVVRQSEFVDPALMRSFYEAMAQGYSVALQNAMDSGEIGRMDPEVLAYCLMGVGDFIGMRWVVWPGRPIPAEILNQVLEFVTTALRYRSDAPSTPVASDGSPEGGGIAGKIAAQVH